MNIIQLFQDYGVPYHTEGYKYCRPGWVNVDCPFCQGGNPGPHLGFEIDNVHTPHCWRCGFHPIVLTISKLININETDVRKILKNYNYFYYSSSKDLTKVKAKPFKLPSNTMLLKESHKKYLEKRGFDADKLENDWHLLGTGPVSFLGDINYKHRIIIPFFWDNKVVSFDSRDITGKHIAKYMACPKEREITPHKEILYGKQKAWGKTGICVEGPTDVWRLGFDSFAVSGINYHPKQVRLMARLFSRIAVVFDVSELKESEFQESEFNKKAFSKLINTSKEPQALLQANKLVEELKFRGVDAFRVPIVGDPGAMEQSEADYFVKQLIK